MHVRRLYILVTFFVLSTLVFDDRSVAVGEEAVLGNDGPVFEGNALTLDAKGYAEEHGIELNEAI